MPRFQLPPTTIHRRTKKPYYDNKYIFTAAGWSEEDLRQEDGYFFPRYDNVTYRVEDFAARNKTDEEIEAQFDLPGYTSFDYIEDEQERLECQQEMQGFDIEAAKAKRDDPDRAPYILGSDPILAACREPTIDEVRKLLTASRSLDEYYRSGEGWHPRPDYTIQAPDHWLILERQAPFGMGFAFCKYGLLYPHTIDSEFLPAVMAHILGYFNSILALRTRYFIIGARYSAAPYELERLPYYSQDSDEWIEEVRPVVVPEQVDVPTRHMMQTRTYYITKNIPHEIKAHTRRILKPLGLPEDLRPKPVDVVIGGGHNYRSFSYKEQSSYSGQYNTQEDDSGKGLLAASEYLSALRSADDELYKQQIAKGRSELTALEEVGKVSFEKGMHRYFQNRRKWANFFKLAQEHADGFAATVLGQGNQLAELLKRYEKLYTADGAQTTHFYGSLTQRIERLRQSTGQLEDFFRF